MADFDTKNEMKNTGIMHEGSFLSQESFSVVDHEKIYLKGAAVMTLITGKGFRIRFLQGVGEIFF